MSADWTGMTSKQNRESGPCEHFSKFPGLGLFLGRQAGAGRGVAVVV